MRSTGQFPIGLSLNVCRAGNEVHVREVKGCIFNIAVMNAIFLVFDTREVAYCNMQ